MAKKKLLNSKSLDNNQKLESSKSRAFDYPLLTYFREISKINPLSREEEHFLGKKIQKGDQESLHELVKRNLKYVVKVANAYKRSGLSLSDLINEGNIGLIQAAYRFDPYKGVKFITYATWWIQQAIRHAVAEQAGVVRLPAKQAALLYKIKAKYKTTIQKHQRIPTSEDIAKELGLSAQEIESILRVYRSHLSLNAPLKDDEETTYIDLLESKNSDSMEDDISVDSLKDQIEELLKGLPPQEEKILRCRFGFNEKGPATLEEIGKKMHLSRERVRQIEKKAKERLRSETKSKILSDFLN